jgi:hypothetical protein
MAAVNAALDGLPAAARGAGRAAFLSTVLTPS